MTINYTTLLGLAKPVTGTETGQWGDVVNDEITSLLEDAVANAATFSVTSGNVTLSTTNGASNQARMSTLIITGTPGTTRNVIAPSQAKIYQVINQSDGAVVIKGSATTGVTIAAGATGTVVWNGSDFVEINSTSSGRIIKGNLQVTGNLQVDGNTQLGNSTSDTLAVTALVNASLLFTDNTYDIGASGATRPRSLFLGTNITVGSLTSTRVPYASTGGLLVDSANMTFNGTRLTVADLADSGLTSGRVTYAGTSGLLQDSSNLTFDGTILSVSSAAVGGTLGMTVGGALNGVTINSTGINLGGSTTITSNTGTANGVAYLNASKVLTTGSALTFDGTNLGIGVASATAPMDIASANSTVGAYIRGRSSDNIGSIYFTANSSTATEYGYLQGRSTDIRLYTANSNPLLFGINSSEQMRLTSTGLGIGTSSPAYKLDVITASAANFIRTGVTTTNSGAGVIFQGSVSGQKNWVIANQYNVNGGLEFTQTTAAGGSTIGSTPSMVLDSSGNLGLGVTPSAWTQYKVIQLYPSASCYLAGYGNEFQIGTSAYFDGSWKYQYSGIAISKYSQASGVHAWYNAPSGTAGNAITFTQAMTLDASGKLGIGVTSPSYTLDVSGTAARFTRSGKFILINANYGGTNTNADIQTDTGMALSFSPAGTERARIDSSGNLLVGTASSKATLTVEGQAAIGSANSTPNGIYLYINDALSDNSYLSRNSNGSGTTTWYIGNQAITTSSDARLKDNVKPSERNAIALLNQWEIVDHTWNDPSDQCESNRNSRGVWTGVVAQQVQPITPWLVNKPTKDVNEDGTINPWTMDFGYAVPLLVKAIQEQQAIIETLAARVAALESK